MSRFGCRKNHFTGDAAIPEPLMLLAAVAAGTRTIRLATTSYLLPVRHPLQAAEQVAVLDRLSGGRVVLGVGRGYATAMFSAFSVSRKEKREIFRDCLDVMMRAWQGETVALDETSEPVLLSPLPVQKPHPPIWVAAFGPKALRQAGSLGFPYLASPMEPIGRLRENYERHRLACNEAGVQIPPEVPIMRTVFVSENTPDSSPISVTGSKKKRESFRDRVSEKVYQWKSTIGPLLGNLRRFATDWTITAPSWA